MFKKSILTISFFLSLAATAHAGQTILNYWPNGTGAMAYRADRSQAELNSALASSRTRSSPVIAPELNQSGNAWRYQGGPKSR